MIIYSDHEPLKGIFSKCKGGPAVAAARIQRWQVLLSMYDVELRYRKASKMRNADALSRLPLNEETGMEEFSVHSLNLTESMPLDQNEIAAATAEDKVLSKVYAMVQSGWEKNLREEFKKYFLKNEALSVEEGCLFYGERIVIPDSLQQKVLSLVHDGHIGVVRMKSLARRYVYWLNIDKDIEEYARYCEPCQCQSNKGSGIKPEKWPESTFPFERVHVDFFFFRGEIFMLVVDSFSKFFYVFLMKKTDAAAVIGKLRTFFAYFGIAKTLVSDNGPPFRSEMYLKFFKANGIRYIHSPIYKPESNGQAEKGVSTVKSALNKFLVDSKYRNIPTQYKLDNFLIKYRNTPTTTTKKTPSDLIFNYRPRTMLDVLRSKVNDHGSVKGGQNRIDVNGQRDDTIVGAKCKEVFFKEGDKIWYKHFYKFDEKKLPGEVLKRIGNKVSRIKVNGSVKEVHGSHLNKRHERKVHFDICDFDYKNKYEEEKKDEEKKIVNSRPNREKKEPVKFQGEQFKNYYHNTK